MKKLIGSLVLFLVLVGLLFFLGTRGVTVVVRNVGEEPLRSVVVHVTGNAYQLGDLKPGEAGSVMVRASSESHVELEQAGGERLVIDCYLEGGYKGRITADVTTSKVVSVKDSIRVGPL